MDDQTKINMEYYSTLYNAFGRGVAIEIVLRSLIIKRYLRGVTSVLDIGCGTCTLLHMLDCKTKAGVDIVALEKNCLVISQDLNSNTALAFSNESFEAVVLSHVLEHLHLWKRIVEEALRVLKKDGTLIIAIPLKQSHPAHTERFSVDVLLATLRAHKVLFSCQKNLYFWSIPPRFNRKGKRYSLLRFVNNVVSKSQTIITFLDGVARIVGEEPKQMVIKVIK